MPIHTYTCANTSQYDATHTLDYGSFKKSNQAAGTFSCILTIKLLSQNHATASIPLKVILRAVKKAPVEYSRAHRRKDKY